MCGALKFEFPTADTRPHSRGTLRPSFCSSLPPQGGRGECRAPMHPQPRVGIKITTRVSHHEFTGKTRHPHTAMVLTGYRVLSPVTGLVCHRRLAKTSSRNLTPASGRQDHTPLPSASRAVRQWHIGVHYIPLPTFVTIASAPRSATGQLGS